MDRFAKHTKITEALRGQPCELELVTRFLLPDGSTQEVANARRATCKRTQRRAGLTVRTFADVDWEALDKVFPFEVFSVADFPEIFSEHVGRRITQGVGTVTKVPLTLISDSGGVWRYAGPQVIGTPGTVLAVYRGFQPAQGAVVNPSEYTVSTAVGLASGVQVLTVEFAREQLDNGRHFHIEADISLPGSRLPADEIARVLTLFGISTDAASFAAAAAYDTVAGFAIDALYNGRTGKAIIEDLCAAARGWLSPPTSTGGWVLVQDSPKASSLSLSTTAHEVEIEEYGDGEVPRSVALYYRPRVSGGDNFGQQLTRATSGASGEREFKNPYIRDHVVADRWLSYMQKRLNALKEASGTIHAVQLANGARISVTDDATHWAGAKDFIATGISRPADSNRVRLREYVESIYTYTAGTLPADASNGYEPDYSFTPPAAPTALQVVSQGQSADNDGKVTAYALIRAVPPTANWQRLMVRVEDTTTNETYAGELVLNGGNYETVIGGLRPNRAHRVLAFAVNSNNVPGTATSWVNFTSATATTALAAPTVSVTQIQSREVKVELTAVADVAGQPKLRRYILFERVGAGSFAEVKRSEERTFIRTVSHGTAYQYRARSEDNVGNESADSSTASITPSARIDDTYIIGQGVSGSSIADNSINRARSFTGTGNTSVNIPNNTNAAILMDTYTFFPSFDRGITVGPVYLQVPSSKPGGNPADLGYVGLANVNAGGTAGVNIDWRKFNT